MHVIHQLIAAGFVASLAAPLSDADAVVRLSQAGSTGTAQTISVMQSNGTYSNAALVSVPKAVVPQQSKRDSASFDVDRPPLILATNGSDFHINNGELEDGDFTGQFYISGDGCMGLPRLFRTYAELTADELASYSEDNTPGEPLPASQCRRCTEPRSLSHLHHPRRCRLQSRSCQGQRPHSSNREGRAMKFSLITETGSCGLCRVHPSSNVARGRNIRSASSSTLRNPNLS